jgi:hypothetical protein
MNADSAFLLRFYGSILMGLFLIVLAVLLKKEVRRDRQGIAIAPAPGAPTAPAEQRHGGEDEEPQIHIDIPLLMFFGIRLPWRLQRSSLLRVTLLVAAGLLFWEAASVDFSTIFPSHMYVDVYYDLRGIKTTLADFSPAELKEAGIPADWERRLPEYDAVLRAHLAEAWRQLDTTYAKDTAFVRRENLRASGETSFALERLGILEYRLRESGGTLNQTIDARGATLTNFTTSFRLRNSEDDYVRSTLPHLLEHPSIILRPQFSQSITVTARGASMPLDHVIVAMTKVHLWYYPRFERTLYLWSAPDGAAIPIGFGIYREA